MDTRELMDKAFRIIQSDKELYQQWCSVHTETERTLMLLEQAYDIGYAQAVSDSIKYR